MSETTTRKLSGYDDLTKIERELLLRQRQIVEVPSALQGTRSWNGVKQYRQTERRWIKVGDDSVLRVKIKGGMVVVRPSRVTLPTGTTYLTFRLEEPDAPATKAKVHASGGTAKAAFHNPETEADKTRT